MALTRLQDDLLHEFKEEHRFVNEQVKLFDPLATSLRKPVAQRLISKGLLLFLELTCLAACLCSIAFALFMNRLYPFYLLSELSRKQYQQQLGSVNVQNLTIGVYCLAGLIALLFFIMSRMLRRMRLKNDILHVAGKNIKSAVGDLLKRKAAIDAIEQRHFTELPFSNTQNTGVNDIPNPGYEEPHP